MGYEAGEAAEQTGAAMSPPGPSAVLLADRAEGLDLYGAAHAMAPLAELCLSRDAETPFALGLVGGPGAGKTFALRRLAEAIAAVAGSKAVVVEVAAVDGDPAPSVAAAVYAALDAAGAGYAELAEDAAHASGDPRRAAERHDELLARLDQERRARDEVETRRARVAETLLHATPGARIDAFARARRATIERRLSRFGFLDGDAGFRRLVSELHAASGASRTTLFARAIWVYRGQTRLIVLGLVAFLLAFAAEWLGDSDAQARLAGLGGSAVSGWLERHGDALGYTVEALVALGLWALALNLWRAAGFTSLLFRGLRMLELDLRERRRQLDASAARLERRIAALQSEAEAASRRAEAMARRAGAASQAPAPAFAAPSDTPERTARDFLRAVSRGGLNAPDRLVIAIDGLDALDPAPARRFVAETLRVAGANAVVVVAADPAHLGRSAVEALFDVAFNVETLPGADALSPLLTGQALEAPPPARALSEPLDAAELAALGAAGALVGARPRALKRFYNAYRLARLGDAPRGLVALSLAALMAPEARVAAAWRAAIAGEGEIVGAGELAPTLAAVGGAGLPKSAARAALAQALRFSPGERAV